MGFKDFPMLSKEEYQTIKEEVQSTDEWKASMEGVQEEYRPTVEGVRFFLSSIVIAMSIVCCLTQGLTAEDALFWQLVLMLLTLRFGWDFEKLSVTNALGLKQKVLQPAVKGKRGNAIKLVAAYRAQIQDKTADSIRNWLNGEWVKVQERENRTGGHCTTAEELFRHLLGSQWKPPPCSGQRSSSQSLSIPEGCSGHVQAISAAAAAGVAADPPSSCDLASDPQRYTPASADISRPSWPLSIPVVGKSFQAFKCWFQSIPEIMAAQEAMIADKLSAISAAVKRSSAQPASGKPAHSTVQTVPSEQPQWLHPIRQPAPPAMPADADVTDSQQTPSTSNQAYEQFIIDWCNVANTTLQALPADPCELDSKFNDALKYADAAGSDVVIKEALTDRKTAVASLQQLDYLKATEPCRLWEVEHLRKLYCAVKTITGVAPKPEGGYEDCYKQEVLHGGATGAFAIRLVRHKYLQENYAAKSFALVAKESRQDASSSAKQSRQDASSSAKQSRQDASISAEQKSRDVRQLPPAVGLRMTDICNAVCEIAFQHEAATGTSGMIVPVAGWSLETIKRAGHAVLCITMLMPLAGLDLLECKILLITSRLFKSLQLRDQQMVLAAITWCVIGDAGAALAALHKLLAKHGDVKMPNIVLKGTSRASDVTTLLRTFFCSDCQLIDMGAATAARRIDGTAVFSQLGEDGGTKELGAPEYAEDGSGPSKNVKVSYAQKGDVYSLGMTAACSMFWARTAPGDDDGPAVRGNISCYTEVEGDSRQDRMERRNDFITALRVQTNPDGWLDQDLIDIITDMTDPDPEKRLDAQGVMDWGRGMVFEKVKSYQKRVAKLLGN